MTLSGQPTAMVLVLRVEVLTSGRAVMPVDGKLMDVQGVGLVIDEDVSPPCDGEVGQILQRPAQYSLHLDGCNDLL